MDKIAVLIPCYNESKTVAKVVADFRHVLPEAVIYVYDNNSTDGTDKLASAAGAVVRYERQQGKGNVIRRMFAEVNSGGWRRYISCRGCTRDGKENLERKSGYGRWRQTVFDLF